MSSALGYTLAGAALLVTGAVVGRFSERLRADIAERQRAQRRLTLYADELERANDHLGAASSGWRRSRRSRAR